MCKTEKNVHLDNFAVVTTLSTMAQCTPMTLVSEDVKKPYLTLQQPPYLLCGAVLFKPEADIIVSTALGLKKTAHDFSLSL